MSKKSYTVHTYHEKLVSWHVYSTDDETWEEVLETVGMLAEGVEYRVTDEQNRVVLESGPQQHVLVVGCPHCKGLLQIGRA